MAKGQSTSFMATSGEYCTTGRTLTVKATLSTRAREAVEAAALLLGIYLMVREGIRDPHPLKVGILVALSLVLATFLLIPSYSLWRRRPLLEVSDEGVHVSYPLEIGLLPWGSFGLAATRGWLGQATLQITSPLIGEELGRRPLLVRLVLGVHPGLRSGDVHVPESILPMPVDVFRAAMDELRPACPTAEVHQGGLTPSATIATTKR